MDRQTLEVHAKVEHTHWWFTGRRVILDQLLARFLHSPARILEVGCGTGGNLGMLQGHGEVVGLDQSSLALQWARQRTDVPLVRAELPGTFPDDLGRFDAICLFDLLEHIDDHLGALVSLHALLKPTGRLFITVPALSWLWSQHDTTFAHKRRYGRKALFNVLEEGGYVVLHSSYFCSVLFPAVAVVRVAGRLLPVPRQGTDFDLPSLGLNRVLHNLFAAEAGLVTRASVPFGSSLLAVASRRRASL